MTENLIRGDLPSQCCRIHLDPTSLGTGKYVMGRIMLWDSTCLFAGLRLA